MTRVPELLNAGVPVAYGHDCVMDPWYSLGQADMLEVAFMALHVTHMASRDDMRFAFEAVTENPARVMNLDGYGLAPGCRADMVLLQASDPIEAIRLKPARLKVIRAGRVIAETPAKVAQLSLDGRPATVDGKDYQPKAAG
jgi:cytosine deaminase